MSYFLPSFFQKRLLRYALSRLEIVDTDALDLDSLGITWGQRSTFELKDVGLRLEKLASTLQLPPEIVITKARVSVTRVTIPADIYASGIIIETEGIQLDLKLVSKKQYSKAKGKKREGQTRGSSQGDDHAEGHHDNILPSTTDLAQSFLESEPVEETAELEAALTSQSSQYIQQSEILSDDGSEESALGLHDGVTLPGFVAGFIKGVIDRLQLKIRDVSVRVAMEVQQDAFQKASSSVKMNPITALLNLGEVAIDGVAPSGSQDQTLKAGKRLIVFSQLHAILVSDETLFSNYSRFSPPDLTSPISRGSLSKQESVRSQSSQASGFGYDDALAQSTILERSSILDEQLEQSHQLQESQILQKSVLSSNDGRFDDADSDDYDPEYRIEPQSQTSPLPEIPFNEDGVNVSLNEALESSLMSDLMDSGSIHPRSPGDLADSTAQHPEHQIIPDMEDEDGEEDHNVSSHNSPDLSLSVSTQSFHSLQGDDEEEEEEEEPSTPIASGNQSHWAEAGPERDNKQQDSSPASQDHHSPTSSNSPSTSSHPDELSESKIFSPEEARSMYMSVMSDDSVESNPVGNMPGAWSHHGMNSVIGEQGINAFGNASEGNPEHLMQDGEDRSGVTPTGSTVLEPISAKDTITDNLPGSDASFHEETHSFRIDPISDIVKNILEIDKVMVWLPPMGIDSTEELSPEARIDPIQRMRESSLGSGHSSVAPNSPRVHFSDRARRDSGSSTLMPFHHPSNSHADDDNDILKNMQKEKAVEISVSSVRVNFDIACGWLLVRMGQDIAQSFSPSATTEEVSSSVVEENQPVPIIVDISSCSLKMLEHLPGHSYLPWMANLTSNSPSTDLEDAMLHIDLTDIGFQSLTAEKTTKARITIQKCKVGHFSEDLISFDAGLKMRDSTRDILSNTSKDISLSIVKGPEVSRLTINTLPVHLTLNLQRLDETISWLGGLSTIIELGNSIASATTVRGDSPDPSRRPRAVHFAQPPIASKQSPSTSSSIWKLNSRIGGVTILVLGEQCCANFETSAVKLVNRLEGIAVQVDKIRVTGPYSNRHNRAAHTTLPALVALDNVRLEFLSTPKETDLDRLLTLLTPSKNKYDDEDDIMIDTLLRQRRQGAVLRLTVGGLTVNINSLAALQPLSHLAEEASKLSRVAKYLPEDDRPGMLALALVRDLEVNITVGGKFGKVRVQLSDAEVGYVSFPSLLASRISTIVMFRNETEELLGQAVLRKPGEKEPTSALPMIMVRYIAEELEPTIKLKIFNTRVEYTVDAIVAFMDLKEGEMSAEDIAANMAQSVVNFAELPTHPMLEFGSSTQGSAAAEPPRENISPIRVSATLKDCLIGLTPRNCLAKSYVVLTGVEFSGVMQNELRSEATLKVAKASMMIVDKAEKEPARTSTRRKRSASSSPQVQRLEELGYVSVCDTSSAQVSVKIMQLKDEGQKSLDVELKDDLLILETCADSTQTLIAILSGLSPPTPPSQAAKYRTEVVPIKDLLQSFAGDAFDTGASNKKGSANAKDTGEDDGDISASELGYISDFFPYHARVETERSEDGVVGGKFEVLVDNSHSAAHVSPGHSPLDFEEDHFSRKSAVGGTAHRWDASRNTYNLTNEAHLQDSPLRVRVRDVHVIWNLYDGYDWWRTRDTISKSVKNLQTRAIERRAKAATKRLSRDLEEEMEPTIDDFLFNSVYIEIPSNKDPRDLTHDINRNIDGLSETGSYATTSTFTGTSAQDGTSRRERLRLARSQHHKMTIELKGVAADLVVFPSSAGETQSSVDVRIHDLEIFDHMPTSTWRKFATYMYDMGEREIGTSMVHVEILNVKPVAELAASEIIMKATVLPLRLHVDHDALDFMTRFFEFKDESASKAEPAPGDVPFLQRVEINPIPLRLDFKPKRLDYAALRSGRTTELMNIFVLDEADMVLRHVIIYGVSGFEKLGKTLNDIWTPDVRNNQLGGVLSGLAPVKSLVTLGSGVRDLIVIPIREYKKDGRIIRGLQKGAFSFAKTTTSELIKIGAKLAIGTQNVLQGAEGYLNSPGVGPSSRAIQPATESPDDDEPIDVGAKQQISLYADQPVGVVQGLRGAFVGLERDLSVARDAIIAVPGEVMETENVTEAARAALRSAPTIILGPAISAAGAVGKTLLGARNTLDPENKRRADEKYRSL